jgi:hypothetical protein
VKVVIANFSRPIDSDLDFAGYWRKWQRPPRTPRCTLFEHRADWGFHIFALGVHLLDIGLASDLEFWDFRPERRAWRHPYGFLWMTFHNERDIAAYLDRFGTPDLYIQHGGVAGRGVLRLLGGRTFRVYVPALRSDDDLTGNHDAECYLVGHEFLDARSMLYVPVVHTDDIRPAAVPKERDFIYLAEAREGKRHDIIIRAAREAGLSGHLHPVQPGQLELDGSRLTTSPWGARRVVELLQTSRIAVYPADHASSPAAMWECVAADLPIVVNARIAGGRHVVVPGVTGELAAEDDFRAVMIEVLRRREQYAPRACYLERWDTVAETERYLDFFRRIGWPG